MLTTAPQLFTYIESAVGTLLLAGDGEALSLIGFPSGKMQHRHKADWQRADAAFTEARLQLDAYFGGELKAFDLRLNPQGTEFQQEFGELCRKFPTAKRETVS